MARLLSLAGTLDGEHTLVIGDFTDRTARNY
jgi:hypothetical protein